MLLLTLRGTPFIYYGEEIGMHDVDIPPHRVKDPYGRRVPGRGRDPERTPMQWSPEPHAGFSSAEPWLPVAPDYPDVNVAVQREDQGSMLNLYRRLLKLRRRTPTLSLGTYASLDGVPGDCFAYLRQFETQRRLITLNLANHDQTLQLPDLGTGRVVLSTHLDREELVDMGSLRLRAHEGCLIELPTHPHPEAPNA
jgi:alpha-glucosidase